jgi:hypothetical protein
MLVGSLLAAMQLSLLWLPLSWPLSRERAWRGPSPRRVVVRLPCLCAVSAVSLKRERLLTMICDSAGERGVDLYMPKMRDSATYLSRIKMVLNVESRA